MRVLALALAAICLGVQGAAGQQVKPGVEGKWRGTLGGSLRLELDLNRAADGVYLGALTSLDQGNVRIPIDRVSQSGDSIVLDVKSVGGRYAAVPSADGTRLTGSWSQNGATQMLNFSRVGAVPAPAAANTPPVTAPSAHPQPLPVDVDMPIAPTPVHAGGKPQIAYELNITNLSGLPMLLTRIDVVDGEKVLASFDGGALNSMLFQPRMNVTDQRSLDAGARVTAFVWLTLESDAVIPKSIRNRITAGNAVAEMAPMPISAAKPIVIGPPLRGANWVALNGPSNTSVHRRALIPIDGHGYIAQRFAIDWVKMNGSSGTFSGDQSNNKSYFAYGNEALAVLDGIVVETKDGIPENVPGVTSRAVPITLETIAGNHIVLDLGGGHYALYAHLQPGSLRVKLGQHVKRGQVLGLVGNTGNSTEPHLHFHIMNGPSPLGAEGIPYVIDSWDEMMAPSVWTARHDQMPLQNAFVRFP